MIFNRNVCNILNSGVKTFLKSTRIGFPNLLYVTGLSRFVQYYFLKRFSVWIHGLAGVTPIVLKVQRSNNKVTARSMSNHFQVAINNFTINLAISRPPCNRGIWDSCCYTSEVNWVLIPTPLFSHGLLFEGWPEFNLNVSGFEKLPSFVSGLALV